jgi:signal peptidase
MPHKAFLALIPVLLAYAILTIYKPTGLMTYLFPILYWSLAALTVLRVCGTEKIQLWFSKTVTTTALLTAALQISALIFAGLFTSFGVSPYSFTPTAMAINTAYFLSPIIAMELSRANIIKSCPKKRIYIGIAVTALFYTFINIPLAKFTTPKTPAETAKFLGSDFLPALAQSLFATYLALLGGPVASIAYLGTLEAFEWLSPILPNPDWPIKALITTLTPAIGFIAANQSVTPFTLMRHGIITRKEATRRTIKTKKHPSLSWMAIAIIGVILIWGSTGLLGFQPNVIASGSMQPTLNVGDIAITIPTQAEKIKIGDIIQYRRPGETAPTIHRVIEINNAGGTIYIITKGDANTAPDEPITITPTQTIGKLVFTIPKLGWASITLKELASNTYTFITTTLPNTIAEGGKLAITNSIYITTALALTAYAYLLHTYHKTKGRNKNEN